MRPTQGVLLVLLPVALLALPAPAVACSCATRGFSVAERIDFTPVGVSRAIFEATVWWVWEGLGPLKSPVRLVFLSNVKPWVGTPVFLIRMGDPNWGCAVRFELGRRYLIDGGGVFLGTTATSVCALTQPIEQAGEVIAELERRARAARP